MRPAPAPVAPAKKPAASMYKRIRRRFRNRIDEDEAYRAAARSSIFRGGGNGV